MLHFRAARLRVRIGRMMALIVLIALVIKGAMTFQEWRGRAERRRLLEEFAFSNLPASAFRESELLDALEEPRLNHSALWLLEKYGSTSPALVRHMVAWLETETWGDRVASRRDFLRVFLYPAQSLKRIKPPADVIIPLLRKATQSREAWIRFQAFDVLGEVAARPVPPPPALSPILLTALRDGEFGVRLRAAEALAHLDVDTRRKAIAILREELQESDRPAQFFATVSLSRFEGGGKLAAEVLANRLRAGELTDRLSDLFLIGRLGPEARSAVPAVVRAMTSRDAGELHQVGWCFRPSESSWGWWNSNEVMDTARWQAPFTDLRSLGVVVLKKIGPEAMREAVEILVGMTRSGDESERLSAVDALAAIGPSSRAFSNVLAVVDRESGGTSVEHFRAVIRLMKALEKIGEGDARLVGEMIRLLKSDDVYKSDQAAVLLGHIDPPPPSAVPALIEALRNKAQMVRCSAATALGHYNGPGREAAIPALLDALGDEDEVARANVAMALAKLRAGADRAIPVVLPMLKSKDPNSRRYAAEVLGEFGPAAGAAVPALEDTRQDAEGVVRDAVEKALKAIVPPDPARNAKP